MRRGRQQMADGGTLNWRAALDLMNHLREFPARLALTATLLMAAKLAAVALPLLLKQIVDRLDETDALIGVPVALIAGYGALRFANVLFGELRDLVFGSVTERAVRRSALQIFTQLHRLDIDYHLGRRTGGVARDIERGVSGIRFLLRFLVYNVVPTLFELLAVATILYWQYGLDFAAITAVSVLGYIAFTVGVTEWRTQHVRLANQLDSAAGTRAVDSLLNYETVKYFGAEPREAQDYDGVLAQWETAQQRQRRSLALLNIGQASIVALSMTSMLWLAAREVSAATMSLGDFVAVNAYLVQLFVPLNMLGFVYREIRRALTDMGQMFEIGRLRPKIVDQPAARPLQLRGGRIEFCDVHFGYDPGRPILQGIDLVVEAGSRVAIVGTSGGGKSTLARLLFRFYDPARGRLRIDGQDIAGLRLDSLRAAIGVVPQDAVLFNASLRFNLNYGNPQASDDQLLRALQQAQLSSFVASLPQGLDTEVGERGLKLSGGEKQRVALARALLKSPAILLLDEATSSLDLHAEAGIQQALRGLDRRCTQLVIAHRLSTVTDADSIVVIDDGKVAEQGRHEALLMRKGLYSALWARQRLAAELGETDQDPASAADKTR